MIIRAPRSAADWEAACALLREYGADPDVVACEPGFMASLAHLARDYSPPAGDFRLAFAAAGGQGGAQDPPPLGCFGLRPLAGHDVELKRLYVLPSAQGQGVGRALLGAGIALARERGAGRLLLDTLPGMRAARALYENAGFRPIPPYLAEPTPGALCYALELEPHVPTA